MHKTHIRLSTRPALGNPPRACRDVHSLVTLEQCTHGLLLRSVGALRCRPLYFTLFHMVQRSMLNCGCECLRFRPLRHRRRSLGRHQSQSFNRTLSSLHGAVRNYGTGALTMLRCYGLCSCVRCAARMRFRILYGNLRSGENTYKCDS